MEDENEDLSEKPAPPAPRVINASHYRDGVLMGKIQIHASTKHGTTLMVSVMPPLELDEGDTLVTESWMFAARNFVVLGKHDRPMKIPGNWFQVRTAKAPLKR